ncbi:sensor histidine kinase [Corynebacterium capitovis]|uniref:sensor histidine kinase n=1 Tax=Corynebacterium capitovis TaxID=131081 RepID=UPI001FE0AF02|nr:histidine kinase [Corynebacterium capitovis]
MDTTVSPARPPGVDWKAAALGAFALALSAAISPLALPALGASLLAIALVALSQRWPHQTGAAMVVLFVCGAAFVGTRSPVLVFTAPFFVASIAFSGRFRFALALALILGYISVTSPFTGQWAPYDLTGTLIFATALSVALWAGSYFRRQRLLHAANQQRLEAEMDDRREQLTRYLHDSVATTLTSVVMRAETLALTSTSGSDVKKSLELIADETREAMQEVRHLIQVTRDDWAIEAETEPLDRTIAEQVSVTSRLLRSHGFEVRGDEEAKLIEGSFPAGFERLFAELATNAIKYALPGSTILLRIVKDETGLHCRLSNVVGGAVSLSHMTSRFGLEEARRLVERHGGTFRARPRLNRWVVDFYLPEPPRADAPTPPVPPKMGGDLRSSMDPRRWSVARHRRK